MTFKLEAKQGDLEFYLGDEPATIGRDQGCEVFLDDALLSREHAKIFWDNGKWVLEDLNSTNGTKVNYKRIAKKAVLRDGDVIQLGEAELVLRNDAASESETVLAAGTEVKGSFFVENDEEGGTALRHQVSLPAGWSLQDSKALSGDGPTYTEADIHRVIHASGIKAKDVDAMLVPVGVTDAVVYGLKPSKKNTWTLGRSETCDIRVSHPSASNEHAMITRKGSRWHITDNDSKNGVKVNRQPVQGAELKHNALVEIGELDLVFRVI